MEEKVIIGGTVYISTEKKDYIVASINNNIATLVNYSSNAILTMDVETLLEIKNIDSIDFEGHNTMTLSF